MSDEEKRLLPGEPETFDDFANAWFDDGDTPIDDGGDVVDNPKKGTIFPMPDAMRFAKEIASAKSLVDARGVVDRWRVALDERGGPESAASARGGIRRLLRAIEAMAGGEDIEPINTRGPHRDVVRYVWPVFTCGNIKLPFWTWSKLPVFTCPGKGTCAAYCYSLKHLGQPAPCFTWAQNTLLAHFRRDILAEAFAKIPDASVLRLHVDGDFEDVAEIAFWMDLLRTRPPRFDDYTQVGGISSYVYSKSWPELIAYDTEDGGWADGFWINVSSGSRWEGNKRARAKLLSIPAVRGEFVVVDDDRLPRRLPGETLSAGEKQEMAKRRALIVRDNMQRRYGAERDAANHRRWYVCPGKCAVCVARGRGQYSHACGSADFRGTVIGIGKH